MGMTNFLFTSESVTEGHPDKVADCISDSVLDAIFTEDTAAFIVKSPLVALNTTVPSVAVVPALLTVPVTVNAPPAVDIDMLSPAPLV